MSLKVQGPPRGEYLRLQQENAVLRKESTDLRSRLDVILEKLVLIASFLERIHSTFSPLTERLLPVEKLGRAVLRGKKKADLKAFEAFVKEKTRAIMVLVTQCNDATDQYYECCPQLVDRMFHHGEPGSTEEFEVWKKDERDDKFLDEKDALFDHAGEPREKVFKEEKLD